MPKINKNNMKIDMECWCICNFGMYSIVYFILHHILVLHKWLIFFSKKYSDCMGSPRALWVIEMVDSWVLFGKKFFRLVGTKLNPSTSCHPQTDGKTERVNKWLEGCLWNYVGEQQKAWTKWLHLGEFCYNTTLHMSIGMSPFRELYDYEALTFFDIIFGDSIAPKSKYCVQ